MASDRVVPFGSGTQYLDWRMRNCENCHKDRQYNPETGEYGPPLCPIEEAFSEGTIMGDVPRGLAERSGWREGVDEYSWECPEREKRTERKCLECAGFIPSQMKITGRCADWPPDTEGCMVAASPACDRFRQPPTRRTGVEVSDE